METDPDIRHVERAAQAAGPRLALRERVDEALELATSDVIDTQPPGRAEVSASASRVNEVMRAYGLEFSVSETGSRIVTRVIDRESGELIRQIPGEAVLRAAERLDDMVGILLSNQV